MADWTWLPKDVLCLVFDNLSTFDRIRCRAVCISWESAAREKPSRRPLTESPWLMLSGPRDGCNFYSLSEKKLHRIDLPEPDIRNRTWIGSSEGWLITADERSEMHLLNPVTRVQIPLPSILSLPSVGPVCDPEGRLTGYLFCFDEFGRGEPLPFSLEETRDYLYAKALVSWSNSNWTVMLVFHPGPLLAFAKAGDEIWTPLDTRPVDDVVVHQGQFYSLDHDGKVKAWDLSGTSPSREITIELPLGDGLRCLYPYLAESSSSTGRQLLLVLRERDSIGIDSVFRTKLFEVYKLDDHGPKWVRMKSLGDQALFIGTNCSICLSSQEFPELKGNCIYFTDDFWETSLFDREATRDVGFYSLDDGRLAPCFPEDIPMSNWPPPVWITPQISYN